MGKGRRPVRGPALAPTAPGAPGKLAASRPPGTPQLPPRLHCTPTAAVFSPRCGPVASCPTMPRRALTAPRRGTGPPCPLTGPRSSLEAASGPWVRRGEAGECGRPERGGTEGSVSESVDARKVAPPHSAVSRPTRRRNYVCAEATDRPLTP